MTNNPSARSIVLFAAETGGYAHYRIPGIVRTGRGTLLAYCEARRSTRGDWGSIDLWMRRSVDNGRTWEAAQPIASPPADVAKNPVALAQKLAGPDEITMNNPVMIAEPAAGSGVVHFLYCVEYARCFYRRSDDDGRTFSDPVEITPTFDAFRREYAWKVLATGPGHGIRLKTGRLVVPVWLSLGTGRHAHRPSAVATIVSDDGGGSWEQGAMVVSHPTLNNPSETAAVELSDGRVMLNIRHQDEPHLRAVTIGPDGRGGWSPIRLDPALPEPICFGSLAHMSTRQESDRNRLLFLNPNNPDGRARRNLTIRLSYDEGLSWPVARAIEPGPSGYGDLVCGPDQTIYCFYERGAGGRGATNPLSLSLAILPRSWLIREPEPPIAAHS